MIWVSKLDSTGTRLPRDEIQLSIVYKHAMNNAASVSLEIEMK